MDVETTKHVLALLAGAMILTGAIVTFVNGRLNEAKTPDARSNVVAWTLTFLALLFFGLAGLALYLKMLLLSLGLMLAGFCFQIADFLRRPGPVSRVETVVTSIACAAFASSITLFVSLSLIESTVDLLGRLIEALAKQNS